ncbi:Ran-binding protein 9 [Globodera pallida]|nr:Ran-binding protein 9 [Globodera pallida]
MPKILHFFFKVGLIIASWSPFYIVLFSNMNNTAEELQNLRTRIEKLERQQHTANLSRGANPQEGVSFSAASSVNCVQSNVCAVRECCERERLVARRKLNDLRQLSAEQRVTIRKLEQQLEELRSKSKNDGQEKASQAKVKAEMAEGQGSSGGVGGVTKGQQQNAGLRGQKRNLSSERRILSLKMNGLTLQNRWDAGACHEALTLSEPGRFIARHYNEGQRFAFCSVFAELPIPTSDVGIFYYEVKILDKNGELSIGLATKQMPLHKCVGLYAGTYAYASTGKFLGYAVECRSCHWHGRPIVEGKPWLDVGDVIGCGVNLATRQIIYTKNGKRLGTVNLLATSTDYLFPCVSLWYPGTRIEANFKPVFKFNIDDGI